MKKTISIFLMMSMLTSFSTLAHAQISAGVNLGIFKTFNDGDDAKFGFKLSGKYDITENIRTGLNIGYYSKSHDVFGGKLRHFVMPITGLFEYSFIEGEFSPYAGAELGIYRIGFSGEGSTLANSYFGLAPIVGVNYEVYQNILLNGNFKYHHIFSKNNSTSAISFNVGAFYIF